MVKRTRRVVILLSIDSMRDRRKSERGEKLESQSFVGRIRKR